MPEQLKNFNEPNASPEEQERIKHGVCAFFDSKLTGLESGAEDSSSGYVQQFYEICTGSNRPWTQQKEFDLPETPVPLRIRFDRHSCYMPQNRRMDIDITPLIEAKDENTLKRAALLILQDVYHESEHIFIPGYELKYGMGLEDRQQTVEYLCHPGEINAFAKQYAFRYSREYPGDSFVLHKMQALAKRLKDENPIRADAYNYFLTFAVPEKQRKYRKWGNLAAVHASIVVETEKHLSKFSPRS